MLSDFDPLRDYVWLGVGAFGLFFAVCLLFVVVDEERTIRLPTLQFFLAHLIFVPLAVGLTVWCYWHPERLDNNPDAIFADMRIYWPYFALFDLLLIAGFVRCRWWNWGVRALRHMQRGQRLLAEGKIAEADAAYAEGRWILDRKGRRK